MDAKLLSISFDGSLFSIQAVRMEYDGTEEGKEEALKHVLAELFKNVPVDIGLLEEDGNHYITVKGRE